MTPLLLSGAYFSPQVISVHVHRLPETPVLIQGLFETMVEKVLHVYGDATQSRSVETVFTFYFEKGPMPNSQHTPHRESEYSLLDVTLRNRSHVQGYLAHKKSPTPLGPS